MFSKCAWIFFLLAVAAAGQNEGGGGRPVQRNTRKVVIDFHSDVLLDLQTNDNDAVSSDLRSAHDAKETSESRQTHKSDRGAMKANDGRRFFSIDAEGAVDQQHHVIMNDKISEAEELVDEEPLVDRAVAMPKSFARKAAKQALVNKDNDGDYHDHLANDTISEVNMAAGRPKSFTRRAANPALGDMDTSGGPDDLCSSGSCCTGRRYTCNGIEWVGKHASLLSCQEACTNKGTDYTYFTAWKANWASGGTGSCLCCKSDGLGTSIPDKDSDTIYGAVGCATTAATPVPPTPVPPTPALPAPTPVPPTPATPQWTKIAPKVANRCDDNQHWRGATNTLDQCKVACTGFIYMTYVARGDKNCACQNQCVKKTRGSNCDLYTSTQDSQPRPPPPPAPTQRPRPRPSPPLGTKACVDLSGTYRKFGIGIDPTGEFMTLAQTGCSGQFLDYSNDYTYTVSGTTLYDGHGTKAAIISGASGSYELRWLANGVTCTQQASNVYVLGDVGSVSCALNTNAVSTKTDCKQAASSLVARFTEASSFRFPAGCIRSDHNPMHPRVLWNNGPGSVHGYQDEGHEVQRPICVQAQGPLPPTKYAYIGCKSGGAWTRPFEDVSITTDGVESCLNKCKNGGYRYGGLECPTASANRVHCQCAHSASINLGTGWCAHGVGHCNGATTVGGYHTGGNGRGSVYDFDA